MSEANRYLEAFLVEAGDLLEQMETSLLGLENDHTDIDIINQLFRAMHTLKGSGGMFGLDDVSAFAHHLETLLDLARAGTLELTPERISLILDGRDLLQKQVEAYRGGPAVPSTDVEALIQKIHTQLPNHSAAEVISSEENLVEQNSNTQNLYRIHFAPQAELFRSGTDPLSLLDELRDLGQLEIIRFEEQTGSWDEFDPESCFLKWELLLHTTASLDDVRDVFIFVEHVSDLLIEEAKELMLAQESPRVGDILIQRGLVSETKLEAALENNRPKVGEVLVKEGLVDAHKVESAIQEQKAIKKIRSEQGTDESIRVSAGRLNQLINLVGELVIIRAQLTRHAELLQNQDLSLSVESVERLIAELRDNVLNIRMLPIGTSFGRFKRLVRDLSKDLGKEMVLETFGDETELDKSVVDKLSEPLMHMIRNSADHGLESAEDRIRCGKSPTGCVQLLARHKGSSVDIIVRDDGRGIDSARVLSKAIEKGIVAQDQVLSEEDVLQLIFHPGFSTAEKITSVSGRGVGMDVVKREIEALRGKIRVQSRMGEGTTFTLTLPLSMSIIDGILVEIGEDPYVLPVAAVEECEELARLQQQSHHERRILYIRGDAVPFIRMRELFHQPAIQNGREEAVIVQTENQRFGLVVDKVLGDHQTVVKSLGHLYRHQEMVSGATILGDGRVALILSVEGILAAAGLEEQNTQIMGIMS